MEKPKPCTACPWIEKGQPLITDELRQANKNEAWFCCHKHGGTCHGSVNVREAEQRKEKA